MRASSRLVLAALALIVATTQGCYCWGWYHYRNCHVYLGVPPGAKTYSHPWYAPGWYGGWPYYSSPTFSLPVSYALYSGGVVSGSDVLSAPASLESAPMPRVHPEGDTPDLLIPPPRPLTPSDKPTAPVAPPPVPGSGLQVRLNGPEQISLSQTANCTLLVQNGTEAACEDVEVVLHLPKVLRVVASTPPAQVRGNEAVWKLVKLAPRHSETLTVTLQPQHTANQAICYATVLARDGTGAASSLSIRIVPSQQ